MSKLRARLSTFLNDKIENKEYDYEQDLNWRDDGDELNDPSANDYLRGYKINPYEFQQWASNKLNMKKVAIQETTVMQYTPEYLADKILTLWNGSDGLLQNFFEAFTLRYTNKMKLDVAAMLDKKGYKVYPVLIEDQPRYANYLFKKIITAKDIRAMEEYYLTNFPESKALDQFVSEVKEIKNSDYDINPIEIESLLEYYKLIYPEDYAMSLVTDNLKKKN